MTEIPLRSGRTAVMADGLVTIPLTQGKSTVIDAADIDKTLPYSWCAAQVRPGHWYAVGSLKSRTVRMHRLLLDLNPGEMGDHRDGDGLNNRRTNLRLATRSQNNRNRRSMGRSSQYIGVSRRRGGRRWEVQIWRDGRACYVGSFADEIEAACAYDAAAYERDPEFARLNFPTDYRR